MDELLNLTLEELLNTPIGSMVRKAIDLFSQIQTKLANENEENKVTILKIGTVLSQVLIGRCFIPGRKISDLTPEEWESIADKVKEIAIDGDEETYTMMVFEAYAKYISISADFLESDMFDRGLIADPALVEDTDKNSVSEPEAEEPEKNFYEDQVAAIRAIAEAINTKTEQLRNQEITEVAYVDDCLWLSLDGMLKCIAAYTSSYTGEEYGTLVKASAMFAFEYGRFKLYEKEQALLTEYLDGQKELDEQLLAEFELFKSDLAAESEAFQKLMDKAFDPDFRVSLMGSVELAQSLGIEEEEILDTVEKIDAFFLD